MIDVLAEHDPDAVDIAHAEFADPVWLVGRVRINHSAAPNDFPEMRVDILDPLEQVDALWTALIANEVDCGVVPPDDRIGVVTEVAGKAQDITIERGSRFNVWDVQDRCALDELGRIRRRSAGMGRL